MFSTTSEIIPANFARSNGFLQSFDNCVYNVIFRFLLPGTYPNTKVNRAALRDLLIHDFTLLGCPNWQTLGVQTGYNLLESLPTLKGSGTLEMTVV